MAMRYSDVETETEWIAAGQIPQSKCAFALLDKHSIITLTLMRTELSRLFYL